MKSFPGSHIYEAVMANSSGYDAVWRTAKDCDGGQCIEIGVQDKIVMIRDSADREGGRIALSQQQWRNFVITVKDGL
jgi:uncharacterized protein DUF397